jgi:hypothetical protein
LRDPAACHSVSSAHDKEANMSRGFGRWGRRFTVLVLLAGLTVLSSVTAANAAHLHPGGGPVVLPSAAANGEVGIARAQEAPADHARKPIIMD